MATTYFHVDAVEGSKALEIRVRFKRYHEARFRWWLARKLIILAARIAHCKLCITHDLD